MDITHTRAYKKAVNDYLRRGTPIECVHPMRRIMKNGVRPLSSQLLHPIALPLTAPGVAKSMLIIIQLGCLVF